MAGDETWGFHYAPESNNINQCSGATLILIQPKISELKYQQENYGFGVLGSKQGFAG